MASSLSNPVNNLPEGSHKIKLQTVIQMFYVSIKNTKKYLMKT